MARAQGPKDVHCNLNPQKLEEIVVAYHVPRSLNPRLPDFNQCVFDYPEGCTAVYHQHLKGGLRLPVKPFIFEVVNYYRVHILQMAPNAMRKIIAFIFISKVLDVEPSVKMLRHFYTGQLQNGWISLSKRPQLDELCLGLSDSLKKGKPEYFFVKSEAYPTAMVTNDLFDWKSDPSPDLLKDEEQALAAKYFQMALW